MARAFGEHPADDAVRLDDRAALKDFIDAYKADIVDAHGLIDTERGLQRIPAVRIAGIGNATRGVPANIDARLLFDLGEEVDRVGLQRRHIGIGVRPVEIARGMPR